MANVKKLSAKTIYGSIDLKKLLAAPDETLTLFTVLGCAVGSKTGQSSYGEWTALLGQFEATHAETGEVSSGANLFLPDVALTPILVALSQEGTRGVEFAIRISAKFVDAAKTGKAGGVPYEYTWEPLLPPDANDPVTRIKARLLALNAPEKDSGQQQQEHQAKSSKKK